MAKDDTKSMMAGVIKRFSQLNNDNPKPKRVENASSETTRPGENTEKKEEKNQELIDAIAVVLGTAFMPLITSKKKDVKNFSGLRTIVGQSYTKSSIYSNIDDLKKAIVGDNKSNKGNLVENFVEFNKTFKDFQTKLFKILKGESSSETEEGEGSVSKSIIEVKSNDPETASKIIDSLDEADDLEAKIKRYHEGVVERYKEVAVGLNDIANMTDKEQKFSGLQKSQNNLKAAVGSMNEKDVKDVKVSLGGWTEMAKAVAICAGILLFGGYVIKYIKKENLLKFTGYLVLFVGSVVFVSAMVGRVAKGSTTALNAAMSLVIKAALIMFIGQLVMPLIDIGSLMAFTATLGVFLLSIGGVLSLVLDMLTQYNKRIKSQTKILGIPVKTEYEGRSGSPAEPLIGPAMELVVGSALIMLVGSFVMPLINPKNLVIFTVTLGLFLFTIFGIVSLVSRLLQSDEGIEEEVFNGKNLKSRTTKSKKSPLNDALKLVIGSALLMLIGSLVVDIIKPGKLLKFTLYLGGFLLAIGSVLTLTRAGWHAAGRGGSAMKMVALATLVMFIGAIAVDKIPLGNLLKFTATLSLFLLGVGLALKYGGLGQKAMVKAHITVMVVGMFSAMMAGVGYLYLKNPGLDGAVWSYCFTICAFIAGIGLALRLLPTDEQMLKAWPVILAIGAMTDLISLSFIGIAYAIQMVGGDIGKLSIGFLLMIGTMVAAAVTSAALAPIAKAAIIGAAAIALIAVSIGGSALMIAYAIKVLSEIKPFDPTPVYNGINTLIDIMWMLVPLTLFSPVLLGAELALLGLSQVISSMAESVEHYANLKVPIYNGTKVIGYRQLSENDFKEAGKNVGVVITVLSKAVIDAYEQNPDMFAWGPFSKLSAACSTLKNLGPMLSKIASSVKDYAELKVPVSWNNEGKATEYRHLNETDFVNASKNVKRVITTLSTAVMNIYEADPQLYSSGVVGDFLKIDTPFTRVVKSNMRLGNMISKISKSVIDFASARIPVKWNEKGEGIEFEHLDTKHFDLARKNILKIMRTLGGAIIEESNNPETKDLYGTDFTDFLGIDNKFTRVIKANMKLGNMISKIGNAVKGVADARITVKWNSKGEGIEFEHLGKKHFELARKNILAIMETMGSAIAEAAKDPNTKDLYGSDWSDFWGIDNMFTRVIKANMKLGDLVSKIADGVKKFATLNVPIYKENSTEIKTYIPLTSRDFVKAGESIQEIVSILGTTLSQEYKKHKNWYDKDDDDNPLFKVVKGCTAMGAMMTDIAKGIQSYAELKFPQYDKDGKITGYVDLNNEETFQNAGNNIGLVVTNLGDKLKELYDKHTDWFNKDNEDNPLFRVIDSCKGMGSMMSDIAKGVKEASQGTFTDDKGNQISLVEKDFQDAAAWVADVTMTMGQKLLELYDLHKNDNSGIFDATITEQSYSIWTGKPDTKYGDTKLGMLIKSLSGIGTLISGVATGVFQMANNVYYDAKGVKHNLGKTEFDNAANWVSTVVSTIGQSLMNTFDKHKDWFDSPIATNEDGIFTDTITYDTKADTPFQKMVNASATIGQFISSIAQGIVTFASGKVPGINGEPDTRINNSVITQASSAIEDVLTAVANSIINVSKTTAFNTNLDSAVNAITKASGVVTNVADALVTLATGSVPTEYDTKTGQVLKSTPINDTTIAMAAASVSHILTAIGTAIITTVKDNEKYFDAGYEVDEFVQDGDNRYIKGLKKADSNKSPFAVAANAFSRFSGLIGEIADAVVTLGSGYYPLVDSKGNPTGKYEKINISDATDNLKTVVTGILTAMNDALKRASDELKAEMTSETTVIGIKVGSKKTTSYEHVSIIGGAMAQMLGLVGDITDAVVNISTMQLPKTNEKGEVIGYEHISVETAIKNAKSVITSIFGTLIGVIKSVNDNYMTYFNNAENGGPSIVKTVADGTGSILKVISTSVDTINDLNALQKEIKFGDDEEFKQFSSKFKNTLEHIVFLGNLLCASTTGDLSVALMQKYNITWTPENTFRTAINSWTQTVQGEAKQENYKTHIKTIRTLITTIINEIANIYEEYKTNAEILKKITDPNSSFTQDIVGAIKSFVNIVQAFIGGSNTNSNSNVSPYVMNYGVGFGASQQNNNDPMSIFSKIGDNAESYIPKIKSAFSVIDAIAEGTIATGSKLISASQLDLSGMVPMINQFKTGLLALMPLLENEVEENIKGSGLLYGSKYLEEMNKSTKYPSSEQMSDLVTRSMLFATSMDNIVTAATMSENVGEKPFKVLSEGISLIDDTVMNMRGMTLFQRESEVMSKFVNTVNLLDVKKISQLNSLVNALNQLAYYLGNIDNLTDVLANKIAQVLNDLANRIANAEETIKGADQLQIRRHKLIEDSLEKVKEMMAETLRVEVTAVGGMTGQPSDNTLDGSSQTKPEGESAEGKSNPKSNETK